MLRPPSSNKETGRTNASATRISVSDAQRDPFCLDRVDLASLQPVPKLIVSNDAYEPARKDVPVLYVAPPFSQPPKSSNWLGSLITAFRLMKAMRRPGTMGLINLGKRSGSLFCLLNSVLAGGPVLAYRVHMPAKAGWLLRRLIGRSLNGVSLIAVWSRAQIANYHSAFTCPKDKFIFFPYKANHSQAPRNPLKVGDYLFSGGNSERDYKTLFEAVRGTGIAVIVSVTEASVVKGLDVPPNVILLSAREPAFERLMAGARMVAFSAKAKILRGTGEGTFLNAMWHGKPVVAADDNSARDYIEDGVDGFVVPAGDAEQLKRRILEIWRNPELAASMGEAGRLKAERLYTHQQHKVRIQTLAMLVYAKVISAARA